MRRGRGNHQAALQAHTRALEIGERLATQPNNTEYQNDLTVGLERVGDMRLKRAETPTPP